MQVINNKVLKTCRTCRHFKPINSNPTSWGECFWNPFWMAMLSTTDHGSISPNQEGCRAHELSLAFPKITG